MRSDTSTTPTDATPTKLLATSKPWLLLDMSRSAWYRLLAEGLVPKPVELPGCRRFWKVSDLERWVGGLKPDGGRRKAKAKAEGGAK